MTRRLETKGYCYIACEIRHLTDKAVLIHDGAREAWLPFSQIEDPGTEELEKGAHVELLLPEWLAQEKGLI
jgi:hypothetical protein